MNVGILTFSEESNYGAMLQTYALQQEIQHLGHNVEVIRYPQHLRLRTRYHEIFTYMRAVRKYRMAFLLADRVYERFRQDCFHRSPLCATPADLRENARRYDAIVVGSDQVWNSAMCTQIGRGLAYFLDFADQLPVRKISYAACIGRPDQPTAAHVYAPRWLRKFDHVSVRNDFSATRVREWTGRTDVAIVADPTVIHDFAALPSTLPDGLPQQFILVYAFPNQRLDIGRAALAHVKHQLQLPVVAIVAASPHQYLDFPGADIFLRTASPCQWVALFARASYVITDSFHGAIFALKHRTPFTAYVDPDGVSRHRLRDLTSRYGAANRLVDNPDTARALPVEIPSAQLDTTRALIAQHTEVSRSFLQQSLQ